MQNTQCYRCSAATPKFSVKPGTYSSAVTVKIKRCKPWSGDLLHDRWLDTDRRVNPLRKKAQALRLNLAFHLVLLFSS